MSISKRPDDVQLKMKENVRASTVKCGKVEIEMLHETCIYNLTDFARSFIM